MPKKSKKSKENTETFVRVCPRCGSTRVSKTFGRNYVSSYFFCQDCDFESPLFPEVSSREIKKLPEMSPAPKYLMWRRPTTAEVKPLEKMEKTTDSVVKAVWIFMVALLVLMLVLMLVLVIL